MDLQSFAKAVDGKVREVSDRASSLFGFKNPISWRLNFKINPRISGLAYYKEDRFELNPLYISSHPEQLINETTPHEIGHLVCHARYPYAKQNHGPEFRYILRRLGYNTSARTYHNYHREDNAVKRLPRHPCGCLKCGESLYLTARKVAKIHIYAHRGCGGKLFFLTNEMKHDSVPQ